MLENWTGDFKNTSAKAPEIGIRSTVISGPTNSKDRLCSMAFAPWTENTEP